MDKKILIVGGIGVALIGYFLYRKSKNLPIIPTNTQSNTPPTSIGDYEEIFHPNDDSKPKGHKQMTALAISKRRKSCSNQKGEWVTTSYGGECINIPPPKSTLNQEKVLLGVPNIGSFNTSQHNPQHTRGTSQNDPNKAYHTGPNGLSNSGNEYVVP
jgi:hypothetical protein